jgi:hypothetical protein
MDVLAPFGRLVLNVGIAIAVLLGVTSLTLNLLDRFARREFFQVPLFIFLAKVLGGVIGVALLYEQYQRHYFDIARLFVDESPWNISVWQFLVERTNPFSYAPIASVNAAYAPGTTATLVLLGAIAATLGLICVAAFRVWPANDAWRSVGLTIGFALWFGYLILFGVSLLFWLLFWLNIWTLLVVALLIQHVRHRI